MKPQTLKTKIFLDSGDPKDTESILSLLGFLDGQTTNPSLIAKSPGAMERLKRGEKFSKKELFDFYKETVQKISLLIPEGSVSIEVYADTGTLAEEMFTQGKEMFSWIKNAHIKYPTNKEGLKAAKRSVKKGMRVNMTLCFTQEQAAAVYSATMGAKKGDVFVSPFIGRLD
ncbi:transaldolase, partial [Patescibacteria group bacterium]|nr:transaldolase [Patescibacteria group bacterium]